MTDTQLGRIEQVNLREIWQNEAGDFTPWLAEHLDLLGEALDLRLTLVEAEGQVGTFSVDVVADTGSGVVVIENQLERTDHAHLGQLLTYAAGRDARVLIWITPDFRDEHRAALDWLNHWTAEEIEIYGVQVRTIRIGDSLPAPEFRPISFPNSWQKQAKRESESGWASGDGPRCREFFQPVVDELLGQGITERVVARSGYSRSYSCDANIPDASYGTAFLARRGGQASVHFYLGGWERERNNRIIDALYDVREAIGREVGAELTWDLRHGDHWSALRILSPGAVTDPPDRLAVLQAWMIEMVPRLKAALEPRLAEIVADLDAEEADGVSGALSSEDL